MVIIFIFAGNTAGMNNKLFFLIAFFVLGFFSGFSQTSTQKWISTSQDESMESMTYLYHDILFLVSYRGSQASTYQEQFTNYSNVLYKSDFDLNFSDSLFLDEIDNYDVLVKRFLKVDNTGLLYWGKAMEKDTQDEQLCLLWFDQDLNLVSSSILGSPDTLEVISDAILCTNGNLLFVGATSFEALQGNYILWEFNENLNQIKKVILEETVEGSPTILEIPGTEKYHFIIGFNTFQFDSNLNYEATYVFPSDISIHPQQQNKRFNDLDYIKTGLYLSAPIPGSPWEMDMAFSVMNENASLMETYTFGIPDSTDTPGKLDFITTDTIYYAGTLNLSLNPVEDSWVSLYTTNLQGVVLDYQFWGGGGQYNFSDLLALPEGGFLLAITKWDYEANPTIITHDILLITKNYGNPVTETSDIEISNDILLYPNPGSDRMHITANGYNLHIRLFDINYRVVLEKDFDIKTTLGTSNLSPGIFVYEISQGNKILERGKWVKY